MNHPRVVHCKKDSYDIYIGRPSKWGNPYSHKPNETGAHMVGSRKESIQRYKEYILSNTSLLEDLKELKGKKLGCWCDPKDCHGTILAELADSLEDYDEEYIHIKSIEYEDIVEELSEVIEQYCKDDYNRIRIEGTKGFIETGLRMVEYINKTRKRKIKIITTDESSANSLVLIN